VVEKITRRKQEYLISWDVATTREIAPAEICGDPSRTEQRRGNRLKKGQKKDYQGEGMDAY